MLCVKSEIKHMRKLRIKPETVNKSKHDQIINTQNHNHSLHQDIKY